MLLSLTAMAIPVVEFSREGYKIRKDFSLKININKGNHWLLRIGVVTSCQKLSIILENKVNWKLMLSKISITKKCAPKSIFFNEKKIRNIAMIFDIENWLWKSNFGFLTLTHYKNSQNLIVSFGCITFLAKNLSNFVSLPWKLHNRYYHTLTASLSKVSFVLMKLQH